MQIVSALAIIFGMCSLMALLLGWGGGNKKLEHVNLIDGAHLW